MSQFASLLTKSGRSAVQLQNISVKCGIYYRAGPVTQSSDLPKVMQPVNNLCCAAILHADSKSCICANSGVLCLVSRTEPGRMVSGLPQWVSSVRRSWGCRCDAEGFFLVLHLFHLFSSDHHSPVKDTGDCINFVFGAWEQKSGAQGVIYMCIDLLTLTNLCLDMSLEWRMLPVCHYLYGRLGETGNLGPATRLRDGQAAASSKEGKHFSLYLTTQDMPDEGRKYESQLVSD